MEYRGSFTIGRKDAVRFYFQSMLREKWHTLPVAGLVGILVAVYYQVGQIEHLAVKVGWFVLAAALGVAFGMLVLFFTAFNKVRDGSRRSGVSSYTQKVLINGFGVQVEANGKESRVPFHKLQGVRETGHDFYISMGADLVWILPKNQMADRAEDCARLRKIFSTVMESKNLHLKK